MFRSRSSTSPDPSEESEDSNERLQDVKRVEKPDTLPFVELVPRWGSSLLAPTQRSVSFDEAAHRRRRAFVIMAYSFGSHHHRFGIADLISYRWH